MSVEVFGEILLGSNVEQAVIANLKTWFPTYLAEVERQEGVTAHSIPEPRSYDTVNDFQKWPENQLPAVVVVSPGLAGLPMTEGDGRTRAAWIVGIAVVASAKDKRSTQNLAKLYAAVVRTLMLQQQSLGGIGMGTSWRHESYTDIPASDERTLGSCQVIFEVDIGDVVHARMGLAQPPDDPYSPDPEWPTVETADVTVQGG